MDQLSQPLETYRHFGVAGNQIEGFAHLDSFRTHLLLKIQTYSKSTSGGVLCVSGSQKILFQLLFVQETVSSFRHPCGLGTVNGSQTSFTIVYWKHFHIIVL